jgi:transposase
LAGGRQLYRSALSLTLGGIPRFEEFRFDGSQRRFAGRVHRMGQALTITRTDHCAADLRAAASKSDDAAQVRRLLAIALALDGDPRSEAAERSGMDRQTLRDWVHRYNDGGIDGLKSRSSPGRAPRLTDAQKAELKALVIAGPDPEHDGVVRWRCADLQAVIERRFSVQVHESTVGKWLHQLGLTRLQPRPVHPKKDPAAEQAFKKTSAPC